MSSNNPLLFRNIVNSIQTLSPGAYLTSFAKNFVLAVMKTGPVPKHVAMIMDGNRRYAKSKNLPLGEGHQAGAESLIHSLDVCYRIGVEVVTIYAFSIENFNRSVDEVELLFNLLRDRLKQLASSKDSFAQVNKVQVRIVGQKSLIPVDILTQLEEIESSTKIEGSKKILNVCIPYTSRNEIMHSMKTIIENIKQGVIESKELITLEELNKNMYMGNDLPPLDILIRTSGHYRLSDFMLWQCTTNCTIEFVDTLWPDFKFWGITSVLFKWMYYKTLQLNDTARSETRRPPRKRVLLLDLPEAPQFASITDR